MTHGHVLHHTADLDWIPLSPGISFKPIVFLPDDSGYQLLLRVEPGTVVPRHRHGATTARAAYLAWCARTGTEVHPDLAGVAARA